MSYTGRYHRRVAEMDLGIYDWKAHSTGYLLKMFRSYRTYAGWRYEHIWFSMSNSDQKHLFEVFWYSEWRERIKMELSKRPHQPNKRARKK